MLNDPERFRDHDPNLNPGGEFIFLPVFLPPGANQNRNFISVVSFVRDNVS